MKVYCVHTEPNYSLPWQVRQQPERGSSSSRGAGSSSNSRERRAPLAVGIAAVLSRLSDASIYSQPDSCPLQQPSVASSCLTRGVHHPTSACRATPISHTNLLLPLLPLLM